MSKKEIESIRRKRHKLSHKRQGMRLKSHENNQTNLFSPRKSPTNHINIIEKLITNKIGIRKFSLQIQ